MAETGHRSASWYPASSNRCGNGKGFARFGHWRPTGAARPRRNARPPMPDHGEARRPLAPARVSVPGIRRRSRTSSPPRAIPRPFVVLVFWQSGGLAPSFGHETGTVDGLLFLSIFAWLGKQGRGSPLPSWLSGLCCAPWPFRWLIALYRAGPRPGMGCPRPWQPERLDALKAAKLTQTGTCQRVSINRADSRLSTGKVIHSGKVQFHLKFNFRGRIA
jgi:hypothetical protein